ncbi:hemerythrin domain-containing protein [Sphingomonas asaccharolytica]|uniref:hemerythrin domain-containing protein n=1 Tax=Sphingomonas asaccharolytica TaxID=40681 RepID=UPI000834B5BA|nr:hemerythrin domain-containing protein [Sphingomonas asaccharolytica]
MDITQLILDEHAEQRKLFSLIEQIDASDKVALGAIWKRLRNLLDSHAEAEERFFYPRLMEIGTGGNDADSAADETEDAIEDHNEIRDTGEEVDKHAVGSADWFAAVGKCNEANSKHMAEEERQGLTDFRRHASVEERHALGIRFASFEADHITGVTPVDKDPKEWVKDHQPAR